MKAFLLLIQVWVVFSTEDHVGDQTVYKEFEALKSQRCDARGAIGVGRNADLLDTSAKLNQFRSSLADVQHAFFDQLVASPKHSFSAFTEDQARATFTHVYTHLDDTGKGVYISLDLSTTDESQLQYILLTWDPAFHLLLTKKAQCDVMKDFNENLMTVFCLRFTEPGVSVMTFLATVERCSYCVALGVDKRMDKSMIDVLTEDKCEVYMDKVRQYKKDGWDVYYLMWCPTAVTPRDIDRITLSNFCDENQQARLKNRTFTSKLKEGALRSIGIKLVGLDCFGSLDTWTTQRVSDYAPYITFMPREIVMNLQLQKALDNFNTFAEVPGILHSRFLRIMGYKVADWWTDNQGSLDSSTKSEIICLVAKFAPNKDLVSLISKADLEAALGTGCSNLELTVDEATDFLKAITKDPGFTWDASKLSALASFIGGLTAAEIVDIPNNVLCDNWQTVKSADIGETELAYIWNKCAASAFPNPNMYDCPELNKIGNLLAALPLADFKQIPQAVLATCLADIAPVLEPLCRRRRPGVCKEVMKKVAAEATANSHSIGQYIKIIGPELTRAIADFSSLEITDLGGFDNLKNIDFSGSKELASAIWKKVKVVNGAVTRDNLKYCGQDFMKVSNLFFVAANELEWKNLCEDENILDVIGHAANMLDKLNGRVIRAIIDKVLKIFGAEDEDTRGICIDGPMIKQAAAFLPYAIGKDLAKFNKDTLRAMLVEVGKKFDVLKKLPRGQMRFITDLTKKVLNIQSSIDIDTVRKTDPFVFCGMSSTDIDKVTNDAIKRFGKELMQCTQLDLDAMIKVVTRFKDLTDSTGPSVIGEYGPMIVIALSKMTASDLTADMKKLLAANVPRLMKSVNAFLRLLETKDDREVPTEEKSRIRTLVDEQLGRLYSIIIEVGVPASRRKRSTATGDCSVLSSFEGNTAFLSVEEIAALDTADLKGCLPQLAQTVWSAEQCVELRNHLVHANGLGPTTSSWQKVDVQALGTLVDCLQTSEVQALPVDDTVINALGEVALEKDADVITAYFAETSLTAATLTSDILSNFGNMVCGLTVSEIGSIPSAVVHESASDLSVVGCMDQSQLAAVANQILAEDGMDWSLKEPVVVDKFGVFVAGFSEDVLKTFAEEHVKEMSSDAIGAIPPATLAGAFTAEDFEAMSTDQSNAITEAQLSQLDDDQRAKVNANTNYVVQVDISNLDNNGSARMSISTVTLLVTFITALLP